MDKTCSSFIPILAPGHRATSYSTEQGTDPHKDFCQAPLSSATSSPKSSYPNRLSFQPLQQGVASRVPRTLPFRGFPLLTSGPLPTSPTLPFTPHPRGKEQPQWRWLLLPDNFQVRPRITCSQKMPRPGGPPPLPRPAPLHLVHSSFPAASRLGSVPECPWESISLAWASHLRVKLPFLHHLLRP